MSHLSASMSRILRQSVLQINTSLALKPSSLRKPLQQTRTIISQQAASKSTRHIDGPYRLQRFGLKNGNTNSKSVFNRRSNSFFHQHRFSSTSANATSSQQQAQAHKQSISQRMKDLSREYGWAAVGVYLVLSALDFPVCYALVRLFGVERIGHYEHLILEEGKKMFYSVVPLERHTTTTTGAIEEVEDHQQQTVVDSEQIAEGASIWTQLALAYAIHKSLFIFVRVPLTVAFTPKIVKTLRGWGWNIGKKIKSPPNPPKTNN